MNKIKRNNNALETININIILELFCVVFVCLFSLKRIL